MKLMACSDLFKFDLSYESIRTCLGKALKTVSSDSAWEGVIVCVSNIVD